MKNQWIAILGSGVMVIGLAVAGTSFADSGNGQRIHGAIPVTNQSEAEFPTMAKITLNQAVQRVAASTPGRVLKAELEEEDGFLVYSVEVAQPDQSVVEVKLDAGSGKTLARRVDKADRRDHEKEDHESDDHEGED